MKRALTIAVKYADDVLTGRKVAGAEVVAACQRFINDLKRKDIEYRDAQPDACLAIIEAFCVHRKGEALDGSPLLGKPFILEPFEVFMIAGMLGFWYTGTNEQRTKEAWIEIARKNGKTSFIAGLAVALAIINRKSGSTVYVVAAALKQALESFKFMLFSLQYKKIIKKFEVKDNSFEHSIKYTFYNAKNEPDGTIEIQIMAANPEAQDSFNANIVIADEVAAYKTPAQYNRFKEATKSFRNRKVIAITTAGDDENTFGYRRQEYAVKVVTGVVEDDSLFVYIARADADAKGNVDYLNPIQHEKANPNYGVTISPDDMMREAQQALNDPQQRKDFLSRSLNRYTAAMRAWFDIGEFRASDRQFNWTIDELAKLGIDWYGGADLSRMYDLTAAALYGTYKGVDIIITHAFFPIVQARRKAEEDQIPLFGWSDDGWLTLCNTPTVNVSDVVKWFSDMRAKGFKIRRVGHDRKFAGEEYFPAMKKAGFKIIDQPQYFYVKSQGFRHIEKAAKDGRLYYLHSEAYEYCVSNVHAIEKTDDAVQYEKVAEKHRIDLFDASVFACVQMITGEEKTKKAKEWFADDE